MSSYDCVLPIGETALRRIARMWAAGLDLPIESSVLRPLGSEVDYRVFSMIRAAAAIVRPVSGDRFYGRLHDRPRVAVAGPRTGSASTAWR